MSENFKRCCDFLSLTDKNIGFVDFICSGKGQNIMTNSSLSIHVEFGIIFYQNFNTNQNFYSFLLAQQGETKSIVPKRFSYRYSFEKYIQSYSPSFAIDDTEKCDLYSNKNAKYLFYKFNDWIESKRKRKTRKRKSSYTPHSKNKK